MNNLIRLFIAIIAITALPHFTYSQSVSINNDGSLANSSAMLDIKSVTKGLLIPRMSRTERNAIATPATGLLIFQNAPDSLGYYYYNGSSWSWLVSSANTDSLTWKTKGNAGTNATNNFMGTIDNVDLSIKTNNIEAIRIATTGAIGLGTNTPGVGPGDASRLDIRDETGALSDITQTVAGTSGAGFHNFVKQRGTLASPAPANATDLLGAINGNVYNGSSYATSASIYLQADGAISPTRAPGTIRFITRDTASGAPLTEKMTIKSTGNVGIGVNNPLIKLDIAGSAAGTNSLQLRSGNSAGSFSSNQILFSWNGGSDYRNAIKTRHNSGAQNNNSIDFYLWSQGVDAITTIGTKAAMTIDGRHRGMVGIGTTAPNSEVHISDGSASLKNVTDAGGFGASMLITDNNIPRIYFEAAADAANKKLMDIRLFNQSLRFASLIDNGSAFDKSDILVVNRDGNVGIGVATPIVALDVNGSATIGTGNTNTGTKSIVSGNGNNLSGNNSTVTGESNTVTAIRSMVAGLSNNVQGEHNIVGGVSNLIVAPYGHSIVAGIQDTLIASASAVFGYLNKVTSFTGFAAGDRNLVSGQNGTAFGYQNLASGERAFVAGLQDTAVGNGSTVFGTGNNGASYNEFAIGMYGTNYTAASTSIFDANDRIFNVGNGTSTSAKADAFTILKNGNVGIGTATPSSKLDVNSNTIRIRTAKTPSSATDTGNTGDIAWDNNFIYVCVATNTWKRVAIATW